MRTLRNTLRGTAPLIIIVIAIILFIESDAKSKITSYLAPAPNYSSDEKLLAKCEEENPTITYICNATHIRISRADEEHEYNSKYIYPKKQLIETYSNLLLGLAILLLAIRLALNTHKLLKNSINMNPLEFTRIFFNFFISRKAELELMRYKRLYENGIITETELSEKKKELKPKIIG